MPNTFDTEVKVVVSQFGVSNHRSPLYVLLSLAHFNQFTNVLSDY